MSQNYWEWRTRVDRPGTAHLQLVNDYGEGGILCGLNVTFDTRKSYDETRCQSCTRTHRRMT